MRKNKNKLLKIVSLFLLFILNFSNVNAVKIVISGNLIEEITWGETFNYYGKLFDEYIPESYKYINLNFKGIKKENEVYKSLQKLVYYNLINNSKTNIISTKIITGYEFYKIAEKIFKTKLINKENIKNLKERKANKLDFEFLKKLLNENESNIEIESTTSANKNIEIKKEIFTDVYKTILNSHYNKNNILEEDLISSAIEGLVKGVNDKHTVYFPPTASKNFYESLNGEYEGIGSYVEMSEPGIVKIISPIKGSPSEKSGLKGGDIIIKVDGKNITKSNSLNEVVSWIKGTSGTTVILTIKRNNKKLNIKVTREKIIIKDVEFKKINNRTFYIDIKSFGDNVDKNFKEVLIQLKKEKYISKIIIDLRNNGGGYLGQVSDILSYFVKKGKKTAIVKYLNNEKSYKSKGYDLINFNKYKIVILQNSGTASASEIMIGTIKDYYPDTIIIGEQSYGKGSVQTIKPYSDGSSLKYTVAKWFTGKNEIGIDGIGITPDIELEFNEDLYKEKKEDNQLKKALQVR